MVKKKSKRDKLTEKVEKGLSKEEYFLGDTKLTTAEKLKFHEERVLQFNLSQLFTKKEKEILKKTLCKDESGMYKKIHSIKKITKSDSEIWSRKIKKKFKAIIMLREFALTMVNLGCMEIKENKED